MKPWIDRLEDENTEAAADRRGLYARIWRWHFFAGLWVAPFGFVLALSGSVYLFNPQIERWLQAGIDDGLTRGAPLSADALAAAAAEHVGGAEFATYRVPEPEHATARIEVRAPAGAQLVWVQRDSGRVVHVMAESSHPMQVAKKLHGELLGGSFGSLFVELAACWMIVLLGTGVYLAWPRSRGWLQLLRPRLDWRRRAGLRSLHVAAGLWVGGVALIFLLSGLPWTGVFGGALGEIQRVTGTDGPGQEFGVTLQSEPPENPAAAPATLEDIVQRIAGESLAAPVEISPPGGRSGVWTVRSMTQRRPDRVTIHYDRYTGSERMRITFADQPAFKQAVSLGIAFHEGALFGFPNQILGVVIALGVAFLCVSGPLLWWKRRPRGAWAVPPDTGAIPLGGAGWLLVIAVCTLLPLVGASVILVSTLERLWEVRTRARAAVPSVD